MIGVVACSKSKLNRAAPARELYTSALFRMSLAYATARCSSVFVASAFHVLVELDQELEPYDASLYGMTRAARARWGRGVAVALHARGLRTGGELMILAGELYEQPITTALIGSGVRIVEPLACMQIGQRLAFLKRAIAEVA